MIASTSDSVPNRPPKLSCRREPGARCAVANSTTAAIPRAFSAAVSDAEEDDDADEEDEEEEKAVCISSV